MEEVRYLYSVNPKKVIKDLPTLPIRSPKSLSLTKEEVKICLKCGSVYRRFANEKRNERVTISNIDRLHNAKFMTEEEYEEYKKSLISDQRGSVITEDPVSPVPDNDEEKTSEEEVTVPDEVVENEEVNNTEEVVNEESSVVETETTVEESKEELPDTDSSYVSESNNKYNNYKKNNKRR
jgi:hypothetical protein